LSGNLDKVEFDRRLPKPAQHVTSAQAANEQNDKNNFALKYWPNEVNGTALPK
jgi:hypothetical protein